MPPQDDYINAFRQQFDSENVLSKRTNDVKKQRNCKGFGPKKCIQLFGKDNQ